ncbi:MAG: TAXI family TRAP transporter solute-binding subunit [Rhizobiales bacterium]|nr:TAXI family TRAP transporter solute-binding subunit [Hyphomicrobiales bacterium]
MLNITSATRTARTARMTVAAALAAGCMQLSGAASAQAPSIATFAVPPEGASGYLIASGYSKLLSAHTPIQKVVLQPFASSSAWPVRMNTGEVHFAQHCGYEQILEAYTGTGPFKSVGALRNIRNIATMYGLPWSVHVVDPNVKSIADLKGKTIFVQVSHTDHVTALRVMLKVAGLDYSKDIKVIPFRSPTEAVQGVSTGRGEAIAFGLIPSLVEIKRSKGMHTIPIPADLAQKVKAADPVWGVTTIAKGRGPLAPEADVPALEIECGMAAAAQTSAETVYQVVKTVYDRHGEWKGVHPLANQATLKKALEIVVVPFHDGAIRFLKESGVWTAELDAKQKELLGK